MTYSDFLLKLRETPRNWELVDNGELQDACGDCPWLAVKEAHGRFSLHPLRASDIWHAADNDLGHDPLIRRDLLEATGVLDGR